MNLEDLKPEHKAALIEAVDSHGFVSMLLHANTQEPLLDAKLIRFEYEEDTAREIVKCIRLTAAGQLVAELLKDNTGLAEQNTSLIKSSVADTHRIAELLRNLRRASNQSEEIAKLNNRIQSLVDASSETLSENRELKAQLEPSESSERWVPVDDVNASGLDAYAQVLATRLNDAPDDLGPWEAVRCSWQWLCETDPDCDTSPSHVACHADLTPISITIPEGS